MQKQHLPERTNWRETAEQLGFTFADMHGEPYWDETSCYAFTLDEVETQIEDPSAELHAMCREAVAHVLVSEELLDKLAIPEAHRDYIADSWRRGDPELYGRFDLIYGGQGPAKLLEFNADTPTSLYESAAFQWQWLEEQIAAGVLADGDDQFNGIHEALVDRFRQLFHENTDIHFAAVSYNPEDYATVEAIAWAAREGGMGAHYTDLEKVGISPDGQFVDDEDRVIGTLFKLYPWEDLLRDDYAQHLATAQCQMIEPAWKAILSNKGLLPVLWQMFEGHPNLLPAFFESDIADVLAGTGAPAAAISGLYDRAGDALDAGYVRKPLFSREGSSIEIFEGGRKTEAATDTAYGEHPRIIQAYQPLPEFDGFHPIIGAWMVGEACVGMGIREDRARITQDLSRFKPHFIRG
ncbi:glutathionylspermidine synthase family protein [Pseudoprimorskyibacter insulae]|uniref:glutathionylspermidine synthase family protein n=1 Tax=Pseudoprimorskyibacter insulae TaxID=1695997 RepID=UPI000D55C171|nr:glutathionylspermidine synthase family protein [Pseudoprimorskyibacter insulae]